MNRKRWRRRAGERRLLRQAEIFRQQLAAAIRFAMAHV